MINVHAPTNEKREEIKEEFYNLREQIVNQKADSDIRIIMKKGSQTHLKHGGGEQCYTQMDR